MNIQIISSIVAATFAGISVLIGLGFLYAGLRMREISYGGPAVVMLGSALNAGYHYTTPLGWVIAAQLITVAWFLLTIRRWTQELEGLG